MRTHQVPFLFYGNVLKPEFRGKKIPNPGNQNDLPATLLRQFNADASAFTWSNDLLNTFRKDFAYADFDESLGWLTPDTSFIYNSRTGKVESSTVHPDIKKAVAYRQLLYKEFMETGNR